MATITRHPTANTPTTGFNGVAANPTNAYSSNDQYATFVSDANPRNDEYAHNFRGFDFSAIPTGSTVTSVNVHVEHKVSSNWSTGDFRMSVWPDVTAAAALAPGVTGAIGPDLQYNHGVASGYLTDTDWNVPLTGTLPTVTQLKGANFGVRVQIAQGNNGGAYTTSIDDIYIVVNYNPPIQTQTGSFTANATKKRTQSGSFTAAAVIAKTQLGSFTADAWALAAAVQGSFFVDAWIKTHFHVDAVIERTQTGASYADAIVLAPQPGSFTADAAFFATIGGSFSANAIILATKTQTFATIAVLEANSGELTFTTDASVRGIAQGFFLADAVILGPKSGITTLDAMILAVNSGSFTTDASVFGTVALSLTIDARVGGGAVERSFTVDAYVSAIGPCVWVSPDNFAGMTATPTLVFLMPAATGNMHFQIELDTDSGFSAPTVVQSPGTGWEYWDGDSWEPIPSSGVPNTFSGNEARYIVQSPLSQATWFRRVRAGVIS